MRLDKFFSDLGILPRSECKKMAKSGRIKVDGIVIKDTSFQLDPNKSIVLFDEKEISYRKYHYIMLNKPDGVISATTSSGEKTVIDLLSDEYKNLELFPCGRLDKDTVGLLLLTNNGELAHYMLSPKKHVNKTYYFECKNELKESDIEVLINGVDIGEKKSTLPAKINLVSKNSGYLTIAEGKYHQVKRMFLAIKNEITFLERTEFAGLKLDSNLSRGEYRLLTKEEIELIESIGE